jgi:transcriptional regulator with GAF, ATPase, and Fis domain
MNRPEPQVSKAAFDQLASYDWPGNVRELQNTVERAIILWRDGPLTFDIPARRQCENTGERAKPSVPSAFLTRDEIKRQQREAIVKALKQTNGRVSGRGGAAELLGMKPTTLASRITTLGINRRRLS